MECSKVALHSGFLRRSTWVAIITIVCDQLIFGISCEPLRFGRWAQPRGHHTMNPKTLQPQPRNQRLGPCAAEVFLSQPMATVRCVCTDEFPQQQFFRSENVLRAQVFPNQSCYKLQCCTKHSNRTNNLFTLPSCVQIFQWQHWIFRVGMEQSTVGDQCVGASEHCKNNISENRHVFRAMTVYSECFCKLQCC